MIFLRAGSPEDVPQDLPSEHLAHLLSAVGVFALLLVLAVLVIDLTRLALAHQMNRPHAMVELVGAVALCVTAVVVIVGVAPIINHLGWLAK